MWEQNEGEKASMERSNTEKEKKLNNKENDETKTKNK